MQPSKRLAICKQCNKQYLYKKVKWYDGWCDDCADARMRKVGRKYEDLERKRTLVDAVKSVYKMERLRRERAKQEQEEQDQSTD